jgi:hypothetical protein
VVPALVPVSKVLGRNDAAALVLQSLSVYPNGVVLNVLIMRSPREPLEPHHLHFTHPERWPRIGARFADGRRAGGKAPGMPGPIDVPKDEQGLPLEPVLMPRGGGGGGTDWHMNLWLYPLPPSGPFRVYATWPAIGLDETMVELDGAAIQAAAKKTIVIWD